MRSVNVKNRRLLAIRWIFITLVTSTFSFYPSSLTSVLQCLWYFSLNARILFSVPRTKKRSNATDDEASLAGDDWCQLLQVPILVQLTHESDILRWPNFGFMLFSLERKRSLLTLKVKNELTTRMSHFTSPMPRLHQWLQFPLVCAVFTAQRELRELPTLAKHLVIFEKFWRTRIASFVGAEHLQCGH